MNDNIVAFPKMKLDTPPQSVEEISEKIAEYKTSFANELSEILWNHVLGEMARAGADLDKNPEELFPSMLLLLESIRSLHLHAGGVHHPLQDFAVEAFEDSELDEDDLDDDEQKDIDPPDDNEQKDIDPPDDNEQKDIDLVVDKSVEIE